MDILGIGSSSFEFSLKNIKSCTVNPPPKDSDRATFLKRLAQSGPGPYLGGKSEKSLVPGTGPSPHWRGGRTSLKISGTRNWPESLL